MAKVSITTKKQSGSYSRIVYLVFKNISDSVLPKSEYKLKVKEGNKVVHQADYHIVGPLEPGEVEEHPVPGVLKNGFFAKQQIFVSAYGNNFELSVGFFG
jgi:hypothetical protein